MTVDVKTKPCPMCQRRSIITMPTEAYSKWVAGEFIQQAWPEGSSDEREMLLTGTHPECWDELADDF